LEPLSGYLQLAALLLQEGPTYGRAWNFGPADDADRTVQWIVQHTAALWGDDARWELDASAQPHEAAQLRLDSTLARMQLPWKPRWNLEQALARVVGWHRAQLAGRNMREFTLAQIEEYMQWTE
jgi:CDP-glucose 4,6-dehydratase